MTATWPSHLLTLEEREALPEDEAFRLELVEGVLSIVPKPVALHRRAVTRVVEIVVTATPLTVRVPDVLVTRSEVVESSPPSP